MLKGEKRNKNFQTRALSLVIAFMMLFSLMPSSLVSAKEKVTTDSIEIDTSTIYTAFEGPRDSTNKLTKLHAFWHDGNNFYAVLSCHNSIKEENVYVEYEGNQVTTGTGISFIEGVSELTLFPTNEEQKVSFELDKSNKKWLIINFGKKSNAIFDFHFDLMGNGNNNGHDLAGSYVISDLLKEFDVIYDQGDHGTISGSINGEKLYENVLEGSLTPEAPVVTADLGWIFDGWKPVIKQTVTRDIKYVAQYKEIVDEKETYTVKFVGYNGQVLKTEEVVSGESATAPIVPTTEGYTFTGWDKAFNNIVADTTVTAQYESNVENPVVVKYTVEFIGYNGQVLKTEEVVSGESATAPIVPTTEGYTFTGWDKVFNNIVADTTVTAQYESNVENPVVVKYTVEFIGYNGQVLKTEEVVSGESATAPIVPTTEGYTFTGWDKAFNNIVADTTVTAQYESNVENPVVVKYTVEFIGYNGQMLKTEEVVSGESATAPIVPTTEGYTFTGWDKAFNNIVADTTVTAQYESNVENPVVVKYTVEFIGYNGQVLKTEEVVSGESATAPIVPTTEGYTFTGWDKAFNNIVADTTVTAQYESNVVNPVVVKYTVEFIGYNGTVLKTEKVESGNGAIAPADPSRSGYRFNGWNVAFDKIVADTTVTAQWVKKSSSSNSNNSVVIDELEVPLAELEKIDHFAYVIGYVDGTIKPENNITREEVAMIFYRLLTDEDRAELLNDSNSFTDIDSERWSNTAISTLYKANVLKGYEDGEFKPTKPITRAEFAAISARFDELELSSETKFTDTSGHWAEKYINSSTVKGWIKGYEDNTFRPETDITRAESMALINNVLGRGVTEENIHPDAMLWIDNTTSDWYFEAVMEATNSHDYLIDENNLELWTGMKANKVWP